MKCCLLALGLSSAVIIVIWLTKLEQKHERAGAKDIGKDRTARRSPVNSAALFLITLCTFDFYVRLEKLNWNSPLSLLHSIFPAVKRARA